MVNKNLVLTGGTSKFNHLSGKGWEFRGTVSGLPIDKQGGICESRLNLLGAG